MTTPPLSHLGTTIKKERQRQRMSMDVLSKVSGVSKGMLSQIEQGKTNPTVVVLCKIATGLHVEPVQLLPTSNKTPRVWKVIRAEDERYIFSSNPQCRIRTLSPLDLEKQIELYELTFASRGKLVSEAHYRGTEEILTVIQGDLQVNSGENEIRLHRGDSIHYAADVTHSISNLNSSPAKALLLVRYKTSS